MNSFETINTDLDNDGILTITLNRPDKLNALNGDLLAELEAVLLSAQQDKHIKALLITGAGKAFCAGADINRLAEINAVQGRQFAEQGQRVFDRLENLGKPSLMAVNGYAFGGGCELAMAGIFRFAAESAQFGQPEIKLGIIPGYGGTQRLTRLVGKGRALDLCLTGRFIGAEEALSWGLVNQVSTAEELLPKSKEFLKSITAMAPHAIKATIDVINQGSDLPMHEAQKIEATQFGLVCSTEDKREGVSAFLEKRQAQFTGD